MSLESFTEQVNKWGKEGRPFFFLLDFELEKPFACALEEAGANGILFDIKGKNNAAPESFGEDVRLEKTPITFGDYLIKFKKVAAGLEAGDSFLTNLTIKTEIRSSLSIRKLFFKARAKYKLLFRDDFLVFSPECFIEIEDGRIHTFPMKGTIDAAIPNASEIILENPKELAEHITIVDLMRNDLSRVAANVRVSRFRYIEALTTSGKNLLQVSSEIVGDLPGDYRSKLGTILVELLPAGSVSGAPKPKTLEIIRDTEQENRGYYAGVFGYFDGRKLDSGVMIRFIEQSGNTLYYRSGGGITANSDAASEYQEAIDKIYVPVD